MIDRVGLKMIYYALNIRKNFSSPKKKQNNERFVMKRYFSSRLFSSSFSSLFLIIFSVRSSFVRREASCHIAFPFLSLSLSLFVFYLFDEHLNANRHGFFSQQIDLDRMPSNFQCLRTNSRTVSSRQNLHRRRFYPSENSFDQRIFQRKFFSRFVLS